MKLWLETRWNRFCFWLVKDIMPTPCELWKIRLRLVAEQIQRKIGIEFKSALGTTAEAMTAFAKAARMAGAELEERENSDLTTP